MTTQYISWKKEHGYPLWEGGGIFWQKYHGALVPAHVKPCFIEINANEKKRLLHASGAWFLRYSSQPCEEKTEWYYILIDSSYDRAKLSSKMRYQIKLGYKMCRVEQVSAEWLAINGYPCYSSSFERYRSAIPVTEEQFKINTLNNIAGPFEYWAVFAKNEKKLVGYCKLDIEDDHISTTVQKYVPEYLKLYTSYALIDAIIEHYVIEKKMTLNNWTRAISHDTNIQDFLLKFGFKRQYCRLNVIYSPILNIMVAVFFPLRHLMAKCPNYGPLHKIKSVLFQEEIHRSFT